MRRPYTLPITDAGGERMPGRILVVDDQDDILQTTALVLRKGGYEVRTASKGLDALESVRQEKPDLILLDIEMPGMDGWETLRLLRLEEPTRDIPVAMFSILFDVNEKIRALQLGAQEYVTKPFSVDDLLGRIEVMLGGRSAGARGMS